MSSFFGGRRLSWTCLEIFIQPNDTSWHEGETGAMGQWIPIPELAEKNHADDGVRVLATGTTLQADRHIATPSIDETLPNSRSEPSHRILMFVRDDFVVQGASGGQRGARSFRLFNEDHAQCNESALTNKVHTVFRHGLQDIHSFLDYYFRLQMANPTDTYLEAGACAGYAEGEGGATPDMRIVTLAEELDNPRHLSRIFEQYES